MGTVNPYEAVQWGNVQFIPSVSHAHCENARDFGNLVRGGLKHVALSNYHPSVPWYPLGEHFTVPEGVIGSPNAEFYNMRGPQYFHANGLGSMYEEPEPAPLRNWETKFRNILANLQHKDGGGITLNHPSWTKNYAIENGETPVLKTQDILDMLDFDARVLGIEFFNAGNVGNESDMWDTDLWDTILRTGRRCWGFAVPDHDAQTADVSYVWRGRNILLVPEFTEHECLKAYRDGRFYSAIYDTDLHFSEISLDAGVLTINAPNALHVDFIVDGTRTEVAGDSATLSIPAGAVYVRVEAHSVDNSIFSNPLIFRPYARPADIAESILIL